MVPDGQIRRAPRKMNVQPRREKYSAFGFAEINFKNPPSRLTEGRLAIVTNARRDAVDAGGASDEGACLRTAKSRGPDAPTLASKLAQKTAPATVTKKPGHRGDREGNR
jgi:hypothetical protein